MYRRTQGFIAFLQFTPVTLKSLIPKPYDFKPITVGDHIRRKRLQLGRFQREVAKRLGVDPTTVLNWEKGRTEPPIASMPGIFRFLGYDPFPPPKSLSQRLLAKRRQMGWTIKEAAEGLGVDPGTWGNWERGELVLYRQHRCLIARMLDFSCDDLDREMATRWGQSHERVQ